MPKRSGIAAQALAMKKQRLADEMVEVEAQEEREKEDELLGELMHLVIGETRLVKSAIRHVKALTEGKETGKDEFPATFIYVWTKEHNAQVLGKMCEKLTPKVLSAMTEHDRRVDQKLMYLAGGMDAKQKIMDHSKGRFNQIMAARHKEMSLPLGNLVWDESGKIDWTQSGIFVLMPEHKKGDKVNHKYTQVRCRPLGDNAIADLPATFNISAEWIFVRPWSWDCVLEAPQTGLGKRAANLSDLFASTSGFRELVLPMDVGGKRDQESRVAKRANARAQAKGKAKAS